MQVRISPDLARRLKRLAKTNKRSVPKEVEIALEKYVAEQPK